MKLLNNPRKIKSEENIIELPWSEIEGDLTVASEILKNIDFDEIMVVVRGGMMPASFLSHKIGVREMSFFHGMKTKSNKPHDYGKLEVISAPSIKKDKKYLIIEDIVFKGETISEVIDYIAKNGGKCTCVYSLVVDEKFFETKFYNSCDIMFLPSTQCEHLKWIRFPWENKIK